MLTSAHQGYYYQDIFGASLLAKEISKGRLDTKFRFDKKEGSEDRFDDIVMYKKNKIVRCQIKYSNANSDHKLCKKDLANGGGYSLALSDLFLTWRELGDYDCEFRICLAWRIPNSEDPILDIFLLDSTVESILGNSIKYRVDVEALWPNNQEPLKSWRKFKKKMKSEDKSEFMKFCKQLIIELALPKASLDLTNY